MAEVVAVEVAADSARLRWQLLPPRQPHGAARSSRPMLICCQKRVHGACRCVQELVNSSRLTSGRAAALGFKTRDGAGTTQYEQVKRAREAEANKQSEHEKSKSRSHEQSGAAQPYHPPTISTMSAPSPPNLASM